MRLGFLPPPWASGSRCWWMAVFGHYVLGLPWQLAVLLVRSVPRPTRLQSSRAADGPAAQAPHRCAGGRVRTQRRSHGRAGHRHLERRVRGVRRLLTVLVILAELVGGPVMGLAIGFGGAWLMRRAALPCRGFTRRRALPDLARLCRRGRGCTPPGSRPCTSPRWCSATGAAHRAATRSFAEGFAWLAQIGSRDARPVALTRADHAGGRRHRGRRGPGPSRSWRAHLGPGQHAVPAATRHGQARAGVRLLGWTGAAPSPIVLATIPLANGVPARHGSSTSCS